MSVGLWKKQQTRACASSSWRSHFWIDIEHLDNLESFDHITQLTSQYRCDDQTLPRNPASHHLPTTNLHPPAKFVISAFSPPCLEQRTTIQKRPRRLRFRRRRSRKTHKHEAEEYAMGRRFAHRHPVDSLRPGILASAAARLENETDRQVRRPTRAATTPPSAPDRPRRHQRLRLPTRLRYGNPTP